ncbi:phosphatidylinositol N-acetylglucosaminyltransferas-like protein subunit C [Paraphoma chrysanthemicola]|uniref:Phosphatidylinositol N-acetylglucosaminyltransferas-like protein subunit C n=1 Tax=Paraphoma chrysanthemicola TaxID=798071 RepID=A0A8K0R0F5_9PLEO|nr:phosphatidylinositol N-acetylglucosaminyltransferas-like protein subunit C [Paraphoma chrysanthemicola]
MHVASRKRSAHRAVSPSSAPYRKLLWFKQPFPDNYTDEATFLDHLQRNPRLQPYQFWSLMSDATIIVQHLSTVVIFCCCFVAIIQGKVSPVAVVVCASICTILAWMLWDYWTSQEMNNLPSTPIDVAIGPNGPTPKTETPRARQTQQRLTTAKSAALIYAALLGLSPILKSLTLSTTSDSIWAFSTWLLLINVASFDYSGRPGTQLPTSMSTNSAMMASTVLASRLPSTTHVFSLTLFSIEVFALFPIFRRKLFAQSWLGHIALTVLLTMTAWGGLFVTLTSGGRVAFVTGVVLGCTLTTICMGACSWWLIGLQKYKNEIHGPWDPAKPIIRRRWD